MGDFGASILRPLHIALYPCHMLIYGLYSMNAKRVTVFYVLNLGISPCYDAGLCEKKNGGGSEGQNKIVRMRMKKILPF